MTAAALLATIATLRKQLAAAREAHTLTADEAQQVFEQVDELQEIAEFLVVEASASSDDDEE